MNIEVGYGDGVRRCVVEESNFAGVIKANNLEAHQEEGVILQNALANPISSLPLREIIHAGESVVVLTSDITRPCPTAVLMPYLLDELRAAGACPDDIKLVFALGSHRAQSKEEKEKLAGPRVYREIQCVDSSDDEFVPVGTTSRGTPVEIMKTVVDADRVICLGNIEYHYFAGYSGGLKAIFPGVSTSRCIEKNHSLMVEPAACVGKLEGNPVREDIEEAASFVGADFILNVILDESKRIVGAVAGDPIKAHREGCKLLDGFYGVKVPQLADIVIVSQGGHPKDLNLYQAQKALDNAQHVVKENGIVILVAACNEGFGQPIFERWMLDAASPDDLIQRLRDRFALGGHKAAAIAAVMKRADVYLVSEIDPDVAERCFFTSFDTLEDAYATAIKAKGPEAKVLIMPHGGSTVPLIEQR